MSQLWRPCSIDKSYPRRLTNSLPWLHLTAMAIKLRFNRDHPSARLWGLCDQRFAEEDGNHRVAIHSSSIGAKGMPLSRTTQRWRSALRSALLVTHFCPSILAQWYHLSLPAAPPAYLRIEASWYLPGRCTSALSSITVSEASVRRLSSNFTYHSCYSTASSSCSDLILSTHLSCLSPWCRAPFAS